MTFLIALLLGYLINGWLGVVIVAILAGLGSCLWAFMQPVTPRPTLVSRRMQEIVRKPQ